MIHPCSPGDPLSPTCQGPSESLPMRLPQFPLRHLLIAIALLAVVLGGTIQLIRWRERSRLFTIKAARLASRARILRRDAGKTYSQWAEDRRRFDQMYPNGKLGDWLLMPVPIEPRQAARQAQRHEQQAAHYRHLARYPWLDEPPTPPPPDAFEPPNFDPTRP